MNYELHIQLSTGWQQMTNVSFEGCQLIRFRDSDSIRVRDKLEGSIALYGDAYEALKLERDNHVIQLNCKVYLTNEIYSGKLQLRGEWFERSNYCLLGVEIDDQYTTLLRNIDIEHDYGYPHFNQYLTTNVKVELRNAFQMRARHFPQNPASDPHITYLWHFCENTSFSDVKEWNKDKEYFQTDYLLLADDGLDAFMSISGQEYRQFAWLTVLGNKRYYAAKKGNRSKSPPPSSNSNDYWQLVGEQAWLMGQRYAPFTFEDAEYSETDKEWQRGGCSEGLFITEFSAPRLFSYLADMIKRADPSIQISFDSFFPYLDANDITYKNLAVYNNEFQDLNDQYQPAPSKFKLSDLIAIYTDLFQCDWRLESGVFVFRHESEYPKQPDQSQVYQFVDTIFNKDWSSEKFNADLKTNVYRESFSIGTSENIDFEKQLLDYDNNAAEKFDYTNTNFEIDFALVISEPENQSKICILKFNASGQVPSSINFLTGEFQYNVDMSLNKLIKTFHTYFHYNAPPFRYASIISFTRSAREIFFTSAISESLFRISSLVDTAKATLVL